MALFVCDRDWTRSEQVLRHALDMSPEDPIAHSWLAEVLIHSQRFPEALAEAQRAYELDPLSTDTNRKVATCEFCLREYENCIRTCRRILDLDGQYILGHWLLGLAQLHAGKGDEALKTFRSACESLSYDPVLLK